MLYEAYRGQYGHKDALIHSRYPSIAFSSEEAAIIYANNPNQRDDIVICPVVLKAVVSIENPIIINYDDCFVDFDYLINVFGVDFTWRMAKKFFYYIVETNNWEEYFSSDYSDLEALERKEPHRLADLYMDIYPLLDDAEFIAHARNKGFDGAIHIGNCVTSSLLEYRVFSQDQILDLKRHH